MVQVVATIAVLGAGYPHADAQVDPYHITAAEEAACSGDAERLCANAYPDEGKLLTCMKANQTSLTSNCRAVFDAGLKRRHMKDH